MKTQMKNFGRILLAVLFFAFTVSGCNKNNDFDDVICGKYNENQLLKEPNGGCYYINSNGNKVYTDSSECDC